MKTNLKIVEAETFLEARLELVEILKKLAIKHVRNKSLRTKKIKVSRADIKKLCAWMQRSVR